MTAGVENIDGRRQNYVLGIFWCPSFKDIAIKTFFLRGTLLIVGFDEPAREFHVGSKVERTRADYEYQCLPAYTLVPHVIVSFGTGQTRSMWRKFCAKFKFA